MRDQAAALRQMVKRHKNHTRALALTSATEGVGKTSIAINLALCLQNRGYRVLLVLIEYVEKGVSSLFRSPNHDLTQVWADALPLTDLVQVGPKGMHILPCGLDIARLNPREQCLLINTVQSVQQNQGYDFLIIDTGTGLERNVFSLLLALDEAVVVAKGDAVNITETYGLVKKIFHVKPHIKISILANMVKSPREGEIIWAKLNTVAQEFLGSQVKYAGYVLEDSYVGKAAHEGRPFTEVYPACCASRSLERVAFNLVS